MKTIVKYLKIDDARKQVQSMLAPKAQHQARSRPHIISRQERASISEDLRQAIHPSWTYSHAKRDNSRLIAQGFKQDEVDMSLQALEQDLGAAGSLFSSPEKEQLYIGVLKSLAADDHYVQGDFVADELHAILRKPLYADFIEIPLIYEDDQGQGRAMKLTIAIDKTSESFKFNWIVSVVSQGEKPEVSVATSNNFINAINPDPRVQDKMAAEDHSLIDTMINSETVSAWLDFILSAKSKEQLLLVSSLSDYDKGLFTNAKSHADGHQDLSTIDKVIQFFNYFEVYAESKQLTDFCKQQAEALKQQSNKYQSSIFGRCKTNTDSASTPANRKGMTPRTR